MVGGEDRPAPAQRVQMRPLRLRDRYSHDPAGTHEERERGLGQAEDPRMVAWGAKIGVHRVRVPHSLAADLLRPGRKPHPGRKPPAPSRTPPWPANADEERNPRHEV